MGRAVAPGTLGPLLKSSRGQFFYRKHVILLAVEKRNIKSEWPDLFKYIQLKYIRKLDPASSIRHFRLRLKNTYQSLEPIRSKYRESHSSFTIFQANQLIEFYLKTNQLLRPLLGKIDLPLVKGFGHNLQRIKSQNGYYMNCEKATKSVGSVRSEQFRDFLAGIISTIATKRFSSSRHCCNKTQVTRCKIFTTVIIVVN